MSLPKPHEYLGDEGCEYAFKRLGEQFPYYMERLYGADSEWIICGVHGHNVEFLKDTDYRVAITNVWTCDDMNNSLKLVATTEPQPNKLLLLLVPII